MEIKLPGKVRVIIETLESNGFEAYAVGGCIRDCVLGKEPQDWDICTSALPSQVISAFGGQRVVETGLKHGTVTIIPDGESFEITTFRSDGIYSDNRHPDSVSFVRELKEDLSRRDFTINAMAYSPAAGLVDLFGGVQDISHKVIKCVGEADKRFHEDALRIMRALRFASVLGFDIDMGTSSSVHDCKDFLVNIAAERIAAELCRLLNGQGAADVLYNYSDVICVFIPEIEAMIGFEQNNPHHHLDVWKHSLAGIAHTPPADTLRLSMLFHDIAKPLCYSESDGIGHFYGHPQKSAEIARNALRRLKFDNETIRIVIELIENHGISFETGGRKAVRRLLSRLGEDRVRQLASIKRADIMAQAEQYRDGRLAKLDVFVSLVDEIIAQQECFTLKDLAVNGRDLINIGITEGKEIGRILNLLLELVIDEKTENSKDALLGEVNSHWLSL